MTRTSQYLGEAGDELGANADKLPRAAAAANPHHPHASNKVLGDVSAIVMAPRREAQPGDLTLMAVAKEVTHIAPLRDMRTVERGTMEGAVNLKRRSLTHVGVPVGGGQLGVLPPVAEAAAGAHQSWLESGSKELYRFIGTKGSSVDKKAFDCIAPRRHSPEEVRRTQSKPPQAPEMLRRWVIAAETSGKACAKFPERTRHRPGGAYSPPPHGRR